MLTFNEKLRVIESKHAQTGALQWRAEVMVEDEKGLHSLQASARAGELRGTAGGWRVALEFTDHPPFGVVAIRVQPRPRRALKRVLLRLPGGRHAVPSLRSTTTRMMLLAGDVFVEKGVVRLGRDREPHIARFLTVLHDERGRGSLLAGVGALADDFSFFRVDGQTLDAGFEPQRELHREERYALAIGLGDDPLRLLDEFGAYLSRFARKRFGSLAGWNSWDYYGGAVSMDDARSEMAAVKASSLADKLSHFVIDMGWWTDWGDNAPNRRFPASYRAIAREIEDAGFVPGIWHAPLLVSPWSHIGRHRQDLCVQAPEGGPATSGQPAILDWTNPEVLEMVHDFFRSLRRAGFRYFKLDYIYSDAVRQAGSRHDETSGPFAIIRNGLRVIREAVGEDSYILNCGTARESSVGITDASRICTDIHAFWSHIWHNSREIACHLWENGNLWNVDPDFAVIRSADTTDDPFPNYIYRRRPWTDRNHFWMAGPEASFEELKVWLTVVHMVGGEVFVSDSIARLNKTGISALRKLFPRLDRSACPVDMFKNAFPRFWLARSGRRAQLAVFNWDDQPSPIVVPSGIDLPSQGADVWSGARIRVSERAVMAPRSAYLLDV